jgi:hypothetical protein
MEYPLTWRVHIEMIEIIAFRTFIKIYSQFRIEHLNASVELILHKALNRSVMTYMPHLGICGRHVSLKIVVCVEHYSLHD